jgi:phosphopantetheine binding protein
MDDAGGTIEDWLIDVCRQLGVRVTEPTDDFFTAGGNSLSVVRLIARTDQRFGEDALTVDELFEHSGIRDIASCIRSKHDRVETTGES